MKSLLIQGGRIIDPSQGIDEIGSLLIADGKVSWLGKREVAPPQPDYDVLNAEGLIVCPGFIDLHCHLRQPEPPLEVAFPLSAACLTPTRLWTVKPP